MPDPLASDAVFLMLQNGHQEGGSKHVCLLSPVRCAQDTRQVKHMAGQLLSHLT